MATTSFIVYELQYCNDDTRISLRRIPTYINVQILINTNLIKDDR